jgi:hypothetical protein
MELVGVFQAGRCNQLLPGRQDQKLQEKGGKKRRKV